MNVSRVIVIIIVILLAIAIISFLSKPASRVKPQAVAIPLKLEKPSVQVDLQVSKKTQKKEAIIVKQSEKVIGLVTAKNEVPFWGNRGYLTKDGKSTFIKPSLLEQLKKEYHQELLKPACK